MFRTQSGDVVLKYMERVLKCIKFNLKIPAYTLFYLSKGFEYFFHFCLKEQVFALCS